MNPALAFSRWLWRRSLRHYKPVMVFTRWDGAKTNIDCCACPHCKNYFFVHRLTIEPPQVCPYCTHRFTGVARVTGEDMRKIQIF